MLDYTKIPIERVREMWKKYPQWYPTVIVTPSLPLNKDAYGYIYETFIDDPDSSLFGKYYIGQFVQHQLRGFESGESYYGSGTIISKYIKARGIKYLKKKILEYATDQDELDRAEIKWITTIDKNPRSLNLKEGGRAGRLSDISRDKISKTVKSKFDNDQEYRKKYNEGRKNMRKYEQKGIPKNLTEEGRQSLRDHARKTHLGRKRSDETRGKISKALTGKKYPNAKRKNTDTEVVCTGCGTIFVVPAWEAKKRKYHNVACAKKYSVTGWAAYHRKIKNG